MFLVAVWFRANATLLKLVCNSISGRCRAIFSLTHVWPVPITQTHVVLLLVCQGGSGILLLLLSTPFFGRTRQSSAGQPLPVTDGLVGTVTNLSLRCNPTGSLDPGNHIPGDRGSDQQVVVGSNQTRLTFQIIQNSLGCVSCAPTLKIWVGRHLADASEPAPGIPH